MSEKQYPHLSANSSESSKAPATLLLLFLANVAAPATAPVSLSLSGRQHILVYKKVEHIAIAAVRSFVIWYVVST